MIQLLRLISVAVNIYMVMIFIRIIFTWFSWVGNSGLVETLARFTDPYINWFRRFPFLKLGNLDLSPIAAIAVLSLGNRIIGTLAIQGTISIGLILAMTLQIVWGVVSFIIVILIIILILRLIAHYTRQNLYNSFWRIIDTVSQHVLYRVNRILFKDRIVNYITAIFISIASLGFSYFILMMLVSFVSRILAGLPL